MTAEGLVVKPFRALRPPPQKASLVACTPYDTVNTDEARALAEGHPESFLRIVRAEVDLPPETDVYAPAVYAQAARNLQLFQDQGLLCREASPSLYVYSQQMGDHVQYGVAACCDVDQYDRGVIRKHERTRQDKLDDRIRLATALSAGAGPVFLVYRDNAAVDELVRAAAAADPLCTVTAHDGTLHRLWRVPDPQAMVQAFAGVTAAYIADGHHRAAAASAVAATRRGANPDHTGDEEYNGFLCVLIPSGQVRIMAYNREVSDLGDLAAAAFLDAVRARFDVVEAPAPAPAAPGRIHMYLDGRWHALVRRSIPDDPAGALDVTALQAELLGPVLGIEDPRKDKRLTFVGGIRGTQALSAAVDSGRAAVAFSLYPVTIEQIMTIADADGIMPPKSTWFEPKLRSGMLVHTF